MPSNYRCCYRFWHRFLSHAKHKRNKVRWRRTILTKWFENLEFSHDVSFEPHQGSFVANPRWRRQVLLDLLKCALTGTNNRKFAQRSQNGRTLWPGRGWNRVMEFRHSHAPKQMAHAGGADRLQSTARYACSVHSADVLCFQQHHRACKLRHARKPVRYLTGTGLRTLGFRV